MKRFLSAILALALVLSLAPMTFATEGEILHPDGDPVVYNFTKEGKTAGEVTYVGSWRSRASYTDYDNMSIFFVQGSRRAAAGNAVTIKINVPEDGLYKPTLTYQGSQYGGIIDMYIVPKAYVDEKGWDITKKDNTSDLSNGAHCIINDFTKNAGTQVKKFISAYDIHNGDNVGAFNAYNAEFVDDITDTVPVELKQGDHYLLVSIIDKNADSVGYSDYDGSTASLVKLSMQKVYSKTQKFVIGTSVLSDETLASASAAGALRSGNLLTTSRNNDNVETGLCYFDDYSEIDEAKGSGKWKYSYLGGATIYLYPNYANLYVAKVRYGNAGYTAGGGSTPYLDTRYVFTLNVKYPGTYDITADVIDLPYGTEADVYIVKESDVNSSSLIKYDAKGECNRMTLEYLKSLPVDGRIGNVGTETRTVKEDYICTKTLEAADYCLILHLNSDNPENTSNKHIMTLGGITLTESTGEVTEPETPVVAKNNVSFGTNIDGTIAAYDVARGDTVNISAPATDKAGNAFKCWVRGTEANGVWVSSKANDTFKVMTNTYLTAVYEAPAAEGGKVVEFYNENGQYIETVAAVDGKAVLPTNNPSLTGYEFAGWYTDEETELKEGAELSSDVTYAVAKYTAKQVIGTIANDVVKVNGAVSDKKSFGDAVTANDAKASYWLRNGEIVKFGTSYEYLIWDAANIMSSYDMTTAVRPTVVIDSTSIDGAYMIEYDKGNQTIAEVGILFGSSEKMTVDSCSYKATSQWNRSHGQFMAKPYGDVSESYARGYMIYGSAGNYKVIYTEAIEIK